MTNQRRIFLFVTFVIFGFQASAQKVQEALYLEIGAVYSYEVVRCTPLDDGSTLLLGQADRIPAENYDDVPWVRKIDAKGQRIWDLRLEEGFCLGHARLAIPLDSNNYLVAFTTQNTGLTKDTCGPLNGLDARVAVVNDSGKVIRSHTFIGSERDDWRGYYYNQQAICLEGYTTSSDQTFKGFDTTLFQVKFHLDGTLDSLFMGREVEEQRMTYLDKYPLDPLKGFPEETKRVTLVDSVVLESRTIYIVNCWDPLLGRNEHQKGHVFLLEKVEGEFRILREFKSFFFRKALFAKKIGPDRFILSMRETKRTLDLLADARYVHRFYVLNEKGKTVKRQEYRSGERLDVNYVSEVVDDEIFLTGTKVAEQGGMTSCYIKLKLHE